MSNETKTVEITVKAKSKKGNGLMAPDEQWYNASKGVSFAPIQKGDKLLLTVVEGSEGGKFVTAFTKTSVAAAPPVTPEVPAPVASPQAAPTVPVPSTSADTMSKADQQDLKKTKGGVAHDAATIVAAMSAMKTDDEVKALYTNLYNHILKTVLG